MKTPRIEEMVEEVFNGYNYASFTWNGDNATGVSCAKKSLRILKQRVKKSLTQAHQAGRDEAKSEVLIELMNLPKISFPADKKLSGLYVEWADINKTLNT